MPSKRRARAPSIDDRRISGNPFDAAKWSLARRRRGWVVLDALGNPIHEASSKAAAAAWWVGITAHE